MNTNDYPQYLPEEIENEPKKDGAVSFLFDILEMVAWSVFVMLLLFTFAFRICRVEGSSMENTLHENETLLTYNLAYTPKQDDIIVFHLTKPEINMEKTLVKRVIATGGQTLTIDYDNREIYVDGVLYADSHRVLKSFSDEIIDQYYTAGTYQYVIPEGKLFVLGDNRNFSNDSRNPAIGFIDEQCVLGKVIMRLQPFTVFSKEN
jgi:signal peptidase I